VVSFLLAFPPKSYMYAAWPAHLITFGLIILENKVFLSECVSGMKFLPLSLDGACTVDHLLLIDP
jgi:hypothetical protein